MSEETAPVAIGDVVAGKYLVDRVLGTGGMGIVVAATHVQLDRRVAIKFLLPAALKNPEVVQRFSREARSASKIQSEHVARVIDVGVLEGGAPYMVMEYLEGSDLSQRIAEERQLPLAETARYVIEACEALAEAHAAGIVHRDLKPANLFLARRPDRTSIVKVLDFGISKAPVGGGGITSTQAIMGSPLYMSPEQLVSAKHVDHRSDVWSLGVVLFETLTGAPPFDGEQMPEIVAKILASPAPSARERRPDLPPEIDVIIARCLAKDPAARYRDVAELARAIAPFALDAGRSVERIARVLGETGPPPALASDSRGDAKAPLAPAATGAWGATQVGIPKRSNAAVWLVAVVLGVCAAVGVAVLAMRSPARDEPHAASSSVLAGPVPGASAVAPVTLAPPAETSSAAPAPLPLPSASPATLLPSRPGAPGKPPAKASSTPSAQPAAPPQAPTATADPLHMQFK